MTNLNSMQRVLTALSHQEADKVPFILTLTMHGAKELGLSIKEYFSRAENVFEGQKRLMQKYQSDAYYAFLHAPLEYAAWGGEVVFVDDGPPNSGEPVIRTKHDIHKLQIPDPKTDKHLGIALDVIRKLAVVATDQKPIIAVVMSPFSLPVMQMGFDKYIELIYEDRELFWGLMEANIRFCVEWANAQLESGASAIVYFDPVSSPGIIPRELYLETGFLVAGRVIPQIKGGVVTHFASGSCMPILEDVIKTGTVGIGVSNSEDIGQLKQICRGKVTVLGNLNGLEMCNWDRQTAELQVKSIIQKAAPGGGLILLDNHGEIPWQVPDEVIHALVDAKDKWGVYPIGETE